METNMWPEIRKEHATPNSAYPRCSPPIQPHCSSAQLLPSRASNRRHAQTPASLLSSRTDDDAPRPPWPSLSVLRLPRRPPTLRNPRTDALVQRRVRSGETPDIPARRPSIREKDDDLILQAHRRRRDKEGPTFCFRCSPPAAARTKQGMNDGLLLLV